MAISAVLIAGIAFAAVATVAVTTRSGVQTSLASQGTVVGLADPAADTVAGGTRSRVSTDWQLTAVDDLGAAEDLLDSLEAHGYDDRELVVMGNSSFAVRWR